MAIHSTAIVDAAAQLGQVSIGPYAVIGPDVVLHDDVEVGPHAVIHGHTVVGTRTIIHSHAVLGGDPQDLKYDDAPTQLVIGCDNIFREFTTAHRGSAGNTVIGDRNFFMANSHVAHDCTVGSDCMFANSVAVAGHVEVGNRAVMGGLAAVHQFSRIGRLAMVGGGAMCAQDVPPFCIAQGDRARLYGLNIIGLRRAGIEKSTIVVLKDSWLTLFTRGMPRKVAMAKALEEHGEVAEVRELVEFLGTTRRGVCRAGST
ncbi:MAG: acyl-ACP--UDP-N-acetylglucosamine O-acyltransferase [Proteobacteria bacterium]|jgi:UDP-N-acetylglucosamine acyltransferase|nr:acyl-ACP--UDP-N-acetylglucosamine O-acyltransferase [Pseudomonadota bacterium]